MPAIFPAYDIYSTPDGFRAEVRFGMASRNCSGLGICSVAANAPTAEFSGGCESAIAYLEVIGKNKVQFRFLKSSVCLKSEKKFFKRGAFVVREAFRLPEDLKEKKQLTTDLIPEGIYPVTESKKYWIVTFHLLQ